MKTTDISFLREDIDFEAKSAQGSDGRGEFPSNFWTTYSAMANSEGGIVLLGVREEDDRSLTILGLTNIDKVKGSLWSGLNNREVINTNLLEERNVETLELDGRVVLSVRIPRASRVQRPVYVGRNPLIGTYRRRFDGDYRCDETTVRRMMAESVEESRDSRILPRYGFDDLDSDSISRYRSEFKATKPNHPWIGADTKEFLYNLGAWGRDRDTAEEGVTIAGLLMFGKLRPMLEVLPNYILDYQEREIPSSTGLEGRWLDRVTTDGSWSGNLFEFYHRVYPKLVNDLRVPFRMERGHKRIDESPVHEALREALVNSLIHADYTGSVGTLIVKRRDMFLFRNSGTLRIPRNLALEGGLSDCRNRNLQKMFQLIGAAEQAGSGLPKIRRAWRDQDWRAPLLNEKFDPDLTRLRLRMISLLPPETTTELERRFGDRFKTLSPPERLALATVCIEGAVTNERLQEITTKHPSDLTGMLGGLVNRGFLRREGRSRGTSYHLPDERPPANPDDPLDSEQMGESSEHLGSASEHLHLEKDLLTLLAKAREHRKIARGEMEDIILRLCADRFLTLREVAKLVTRDPGTIRVHYLAQMVKAGDLELRYPSSPRHPNQGYRTRKKLANS